MEEDNNDYSAICFAIAGMIAGVAFAWAIIVSFIEWWIV